MNAILSLALFVAVATTSASPAETRNSDHHREKRAIPAIPFKPNPLGYLPYALLFSGGGQKPGDLSKAPPQVAAMLQMG